jgi:hypothetical protein
MLARQLLLPPEMRVSRSFLASIPSFVVVMLAAGHARAQDAEPSPVGSCSGTTAAGSEVVAIASGTQPERWVVKSGSPVDVTQSRRPDNLNPWGISFSDCQEDMRLDFSLTLTNFAGNDEAHVEVWAGVMDCSVDANRYVENAGVSQPCWQVATKTITQVAGTSPIALTESVYARDVLRYEQGPQAGQGLTYDPSFHAGPDGETACSVQTGDAQVSINVYFLAVDSAEKVVGQPGCYELGTDLVGPPPPPQVSVKGGDKLLTVSWTSPGDDPDVDGFDVWSDPPAGGAQSSSSLAGCGCSIAPGAQPSEETTDDVANSPFVVDAADEQAPESGSEFDSSAGASDAREAGSDASSADGSSERDGGADAAAGDAGATDGAVCNSEALTKFSSVVGNGGISQIDPTYLANAFAGSTPPSSGSPLTLTGMHNGQTYAVVVTSTDAYGNDGPASAPSCAVPSAVSDFWQTYEGSGGSAATCAFEAGGGSAGGAVIPGLLLTTAAALLRRRARKVVDRAKRS